MFLVLFFDFEKNLENQPVLPITENKQKASFHVSVCVCESVSVRVCVLV